MLEAFLLIYLLLAMRNSGQSYELNMNAIPAEAGLNYESLPVSLEAGAYRVYVNYNVSHDMANIIDVYSLSAPYGSLKANTTILYAGRNHTSHIIWLKDAISDLQVKVTYGGAGTLEVYGGSLVRTNLAERQNILITVFLLTLLNLILHSRERSMYKKQEMLRTGAILGIIIMGCSLPLFTDYMLPGADMTFHLLRIEGVKDALLSGQFPARMHPNWLQGHGYAAGIFYSDFFLYFPAVLRIMGFTVQTAYKCYKFVVNITTCLIAFYSFSKMFKNRELGLLGSFLYTFQVVRLINIYGVDAVGQYTAMSFLPLIVYGFHCIFTKNREEEDYKYSFIVLALGLSGIIESHVLTCVISALFILLLCVICLPKLRNIKIFLELVKTVVLTLLLNAWYLVPFLDYNFSMDFAVTKGGATLKQIQTWGMYIPQLFEAFPLGGQYGASDASRGIPGETTYSMGLGIVIAFFVILFLLFVSKKFRKDKTCLVTISFAIVALIMATIHFPWDKLAKSNGILRQLIATLQFPYRMMTIAPLFIIVALLCCLKIMENEKAVAIIACCTIMGTVMTAWFFMDTTMTESGGYVRIYDETSMGNGYISGGEYVLLGTDTHLLTYKAPVYSEGVMFNSWYKNGCNVQLDLDMAAGSDGYVELPLLYYKGYKAVESGGFELPVVCGDNNVVRVIVPSGFQGIIDVDFVSPWYWRVSELVSMMALVGIGLWILKCRRSCS